MCWSAKWRELLELQQSGWLTGQGANREVPAYRRLSENLVGIQVNQDLANLCDLPMKILIKIVVALAVSLAAISANSKVLADGAKQSEAQRLSTVRKLVREEPSVRFHKLSRSPGSPALDCTDMLNALLSNRGLKPIEPSVILDHDHLPVDRSWLPPSLERDKGSAEEAANEQRLGRELAAKIRWCASEPEQLGGRHAGYFDGFSFLVGAPPYRIYELPKELNPYPQADLFFWASYEPVNHHGGKFSWVDLQQCSYVSGANAVSSPDQASNRQDHQVAISQYKMGIAIWSVAPRFSFEAQYWRPAANQEPAVNQVCSWSTFPVEAEPNQSSKP